MTLEQITKLIDAGYTKDEINELCDLQQGDSEPPEEKPDEKEPEEKSDEKEPEPEKHYPDEIAKLTEQVKTLTETMQKHFIDAAEKKTPVDDGTDVLKNILEKGVIE